MNILDLSMDTTENTRFVNMYHDLIQQSLKDTSFNESELNCLLLIYHKFLLQNDTRTKEISKDQLLQMFLVVFKIFDLHIIEQILTTHSNDSGCIGPKGWIDFFEVIMNGDLNVKMKYVYNIYTLNGTVVMNRTLISDYVAKMFEASFLEEEEQNELITDMVETLFSKFDSDKDGIITFEEYAVVVKDEPLLLEFLGKVFPMARGLTVIAFCLNLRFEMNKLDLLLDEIQNTRFQNKYHDFVKTLSKTTKFTETELNCILMVYNKFVLADKSALGMSSAKLSQLFQLWYIHDTVIIQRIILKHLSSEGYVNAKGWVDFMSMVMCDDLELQMPYVFEIYDIDGRGFLARDAVSTFVAKMFQTQGYEEDEVVELILDMVETIFIKFDLDKDGNITFEEYKQVVRESPMLLEFLGQVFPVSELKNVQAHCFNIISKINL